MERRFVWGFGMLFKQYGKRVPTDPKAALLRQLKMNAAIVQPAMQRVEIDSKSGNDFRVTNEGRAFSTLVAVRRGYGTTIPREDGFRRFDGDLARHFSPSLQGAPCADHRKSLLLQAGWLRIRGKTSQAPRIGRYL